MRSKTTLLMSFFMFSMVQVSSEVQLVEAAKYLSNYEQNSTMNLFSDTRTIYNINILATALITNTGWPQHVRQIAFNLNNFAPSVFLREQDKYRKYISLGICQGSGFSGWLCAFDLTGIDDRALRIGEDSQSYLAIWKEDNSLEFIHNYSIKQLGSFITFVPNEQFVDILNRLLFDPEIARIQQRQEQRLDEREKAHQIRAGKWAARKEVRRQREAMKSAGQRPLSTLQGYDWDKLEGGFRRSGDVSSSSSGGSPASSDFGTPPHGGTPPQGRNGFISGDGRYYFD